jgi:ribosomal-protein-alanine N-acetyltransferase
MTPTFETKRLLLVPRGLEDCKAIQELFPVWEIVRYLTAKVPWPYPEDGSLRNYLDLVQPAVESGDEWHWTLRLKSAPEQVIGVICLCRGETENRGFWLGVPWQGQGLMTKAVEAVTQYWFDTLGFERLRVPKAVNNVASRKISERGGMRVVEAQEKEYVCGRLWSETWEITAAEWRLQKRRDG